MKAALAALFLCWFISGAGALEPQEQPAASLASEQPEVPGQAPRIGPGQGTDNAIQAQKDSKASPERAANPAPVIPMMMPPFDYGKGQGYAQNAYENRSEFWAAFGVRLRQGEALLIGFTALLFIATLALWWTTRNLVKEARRTAQHQLRAYVSLAADLPVSINSKGASFIVRSQNYGQTPANNVRVSIETIIVSKNSKINWEGRGNHIAPRSVIHPTQVKYFIFNPAVISEIEGFHAGTHDLYLFGKMSYNDVFKKEWYTNFRQVLAKGAEGQPAWHFCDEGNEAT